MEDQLEKLDAELTETIESLKERDAELAELHAENKGNRMVGRGELR